jgi:hypothetical protein
MFQKHKIWTLIRKNYSYEYNNNIESKWRPIEPIIKNVKMSKTQSFIIIRIQFSIQCVVVKAINCSKELLLNELAFDPTKVKKNTLIFTTLSWIWTKEKIFLLAHLQHEILNVDLKEI